MFSSRVASLPVMEQAIAAHATRLGEKLRRQALGGGADNPWLIAVRGDVAKARKLATMEDSAKHVREQPRDMELAGSAEFVEHPAALPSFKRRYQFQMPREKLVLSSASEKRSCPESSATFNRQPLPSSKRSGFSFLISSSAFRISGRTSSVSPTSIPL
jgi:hypothetical protein